MSNNNTKPECLKIFFKLKQQEGIIEKSIETFIESSKVYPELWRDIIHDIDRFETEYKKLADSFRKKIIDIYQELKNVKCMIQEDKVKNLDLEDFKNKLQGLCKRIQEFKDSNKKTEKLIEEQSNLENDLNAMIKVIEKQKIFSSDDNFYCRTSNLMSQAQKYKSTKDLDYEEVEDFSTLLAKTGHTGSWSQEDHLLYLKLRKKNKSLPALVRSILAKCPDMSKESIINHDAWYKTYLQLRDRQKAAVREWRERKESMRLATKEITPLLVDEVLPPKKPQTICEDDPKKVEEEKKKEMVRQWKERKQNLKAAEEERLKNLARARKEDKENRRKKRDAEIKKLLAEHKENKLVREQEVAREATKSLYDSSFILQLYRERDQEFLDKRKNISVSKVNVPKKVTQCNIAKSYESLLGEPKDWQEKTKKIEPQVSLARDYSRRSAVSWKSYYELPDPFYY